jgi:hypothetical protein
MFSKSIIGTSTRVFPEAARRTYKWFDKEGGKKQVLWTNVPRPMFNWNTPSVDSKSCLTMEYWSGRICRHCSTSKAIHFGCSAGFHLRTQVNSDKRACGSLSASKSQIRWSLSSKTHRVAQSRHSDTISVLFCSTISGRNRSIVAPSSHISRNMSKFTTTSARPEHTANFAFMDWSYCPNVSRIDTSVSRLADTTCFNRTRATSR